MGQYLAIGIDHKYVVSQDSAEKVGKTLDEIVGVLQKQYAPEDFKTTSTASLIGLGLKRYGAV